MIPAEYNFPDQYKGDTFIGMQFTVVKNDAPLDLTGVAFLMDLRNPKTGNSALTLKDGSGITVTDALNGIFQIDPTIININAGKYSYDIQMTFPDQTVETYIAGSWYIEQDVSRV